MHWSRSESKHSIFYVLLRVLPHIQKSISRQNFALFLFWVRKKSKVVRRKRRTSSIPIWNCEWKKGFRGGGLLLFYVGRQRRCIVTANINVAHKTELDWKDVEVCTFMSFIHYAILCSSWVVHFCKSMNCNGTSQRLLHPEYMVVFDCISRLTKNVMKSPSFH